MVKAADIGKGSRDFVSKDFFAGNEVKVNQGGCGKNTTTFKIGDSIKADHKIDLNKVHCPSTEPWSTFPDGDNICFSAALAVHWPQSVTNWPPAWIMNQKESSKLPMLMLLSNSTQTWLNAWTWTHTLSKRLSKHQSKISWLINYDSSFITRDVAGIATVFDMTTAMKGVSLKPVDFGLAFAKQGYQFGVTGTVPNVAAPSVINTKFRVGFAGCSHFNVRFFLSVTHKYD